MTLTLSSTILLSGTETSGFWSIVVSNSQTSLHGTDTTAAAMKLSIMYVASSISKLASKLISQGNFGFSSCSDCFLVTTCDVIHTQRRVTKKTSTHNNIFTTKHTESSFEAWTLVKHVFTSSTTSDVCTFAFARKVASSAIFQACFGLLP